MSKMQYPLFICESLNLSPPENMLKDADFCKSTSFLLYGIIPWIDI